MNQVYSKYDRLKYASYKRFHPGYEGERIKSIDWWKGYAIMWIAFEHLLGDWLTTDNQWFARVLLLYLEILGNTTFLFFAGVNITLKWRFASMKGARFKPFIIATIRKMLALWFISICSNFVLSIYYGEGIVWEYSTFFRWNILQALAFSIILAGCLLKRSVWTRLLITALILIFTLPIYQYLAGIRSVSTFADMLVYMIFDPYVGAPLFPMVAYAIAGSVVIDFLLPYKYPNTSENEDFYQNIFGLPFKRHINLHKTKKSYIIMFSFAAISLAVSIIIGSGPNQISTFDSVAISWFDALDDHVLITEVLGYIPEFLIVNHPLNYLYKLSMITVIFCIIFYYFDLSRGENYKPSAISRAWIFMGKISLSYWIYVALFNLIPIDTNPILAWPFMIGALILLSYIFKKNIKHYKGAGLIEWVILFLSFTWLDVKVKFKE